MPLTSFKTTFKILLLTSITCIAVLSCQKTPISDTKQPPVYKAMSYIPDTNFLPITDAQLFAEQITSDVFRGRENKNTIRAISSSFTIDDNKGIPALYVFNYGNNEGYLVMSADYRFEPICAFTDDGSISITDNLPSMLASWFNHTVEIIEAIREGSLSEGIEGGQIAWVKLGGKIHLEYLPSNFSVLTGIYSEIDCNPYNYYTVDSLLNNRWGQDCTYNNLIPVTGCPGNQCGRAPTGCVATAGAILSHYWAQPSTSFHYNYAVMPRNIGDTGSQRLMLNIGQIADMDWDCDGSSTQTDELTNFYQNYLFYNSPGEYDDYENSSRWVIKNDIDAGKPVILDGCTENATIFHWSHGNCHTWLCDGYKLTTSNCFSGRFHLHMNWGWDGHYNGFYYQADQWPVNSTYQYSRKFLHNIHP